ncbi:MAG: hypothetical protein KatS3mg118_0376 [Paracoccaceae bacterium]|nr:MAG: hypothetical protein KatS3mg118_0376 [Paracoccaceae bacterium]
MQRKDNTGSDETGTQPAPPAPQADQPPAPDHPAPEGGRQQDWPESAPAAEPEWAGPAPDAPEPRHRAGAEPPDAAEPRRETEAESPPPDDAATDRPGAAPDADTPPADTPPADTPPADTPPADAPPESGTVRWAPEWDETRATLETPADREEPRHDPSPAGEPEPAPPDPAEMDDAAHAHAEEERHSLAGRVLTILALLIAGGILFLWAGPRIAPHLPAGLEPVAAWLAPGTETAAEQARAREALRAELMARIDAIRPGMPPEAVEALVGERIAALGSAIAQEQQAAIADLRRRIDALADHVAAQDSGEIEARLAQVETALSGLKAELAALKETLAGLENQPAGTMPEEALARIAAFQSTVEGVRGELAGLARQVGSLAQRIDEVEAASRRREAEAQAEAARIAAQAEARRRAAQLRAALAELEARIATGAPFADALAQVTEIAPDAVPEALTRAAERGVPTVKDLLDSFPPVAHAAIRASIKAGAGGGILERATSFMEARIAPRSLTEREGNDTDAILSRIEARLREDRADLALAEAEALAPEARAPMREWLDRLGERARAMAALDALRAAADAMTTN